MSIQQSIQTGLLIGNAIQTSRLRKEIAQMQQMAVLQQNQQQEIEGWRQVVFESRKILDEAACSVDHDPVTAVYLTRIAHTSLHRINEAIFPQLQEKEIFYQVRRQTDLLLAQGETRVSPEIAQDLHRLVWLEQTRLPFFSFMTWLAIEEKLQDANIVFLPGAAIFFGGMILANIIAPLSWMMFHAAILSCIIWLATNGITLLIIAGAARSKILAACDQMAKKAGGWVGPDATPKIATMLAEKARAHLSSWGHKSTANSSYEAGKGLAAVDAEILQLRQLYFPTN